MPLVNVHLLQLFESKGKGQKFAQICDGPFEVIKQVSPVVYRIRIPHFYGIHPVISIVHLTPFKTDQDSPRPDLKPLQENPEEYMVEEIVAQKRARYRRGYRTLYQCKWKSYRVTDD